MRSTILFITACSTLDPLMEPPFDTDDTASEVDDICSNTGIGIPEETDRDEGQSTIDVDWMTTELAFIKVTAECLTIPPFWIYTTQNEELPITFLTFSIGSYDNGEWVEKFGDELTIETTFGKLGSYESVGTACEPFCGPYWEMDLTEENLTVGPQQDIYVLFDLQGFNDPSEIEEIWDEEKDQLAIMVYAGHFWTEETSPGHYEYGGYSSGSLLTIAVDIVE